MPSVLSFGSTSSSAYPPSRSQLYLPTFIYYSWQLPTADQFMHDTIVQSQQTLQATAVAEGQDLSNASVYGNYAVAGTPLEEIYGENLPRLQALKREVDPTNVMGLAGGWKFA
jgi:FAD/FMN-containing dehydrogenase